jgi:hypothetical protein
MWYRRSLEHYIWYGRPSMALSELSIRDWTYQAARRRMVRVGGIELARHVGTGRLDARGNRIVDCSCGWAGNGIGWGGHLDDVVRHAVHVAPRGR